MIHNSICYYNNTKNRIILAVIRFFCYLCNMKAVVHILSLAVLGVLTVSAQTVPVTKIEPERLPDLNIPRFSHATFYAANGELTVAGGHTTSFVPTPTAEYLKDGQWHVVQMAYPHDDGLCVPLRNGKVLLAGGYKENLGVGQTIEAERYAPATHTFEGFGCLDRRRTHVSAVELPNGQVVAAGNWYHADAIETYDGGMYFETARDVSVPRSLPYLFCVSDSDVIVVSGYWDNYGKVIRNNSIVDRLKGASFRVPLFETWQPYLLPNAPRTDDSFIGDMEKGLFAYLLPVRDSMGQVAICEVRDTVFSLLPTATPVPMKYRQDSIIYNTPVIVDRQSQRGYVMGGDTIGRTYILCIEYAKRPAALTLYYADPLPEAAGGIPILTADGNLITTGGIAHGGTWFTPTKCVWLFPVGNRTGNEAEAQMTFSQRYWPIYFAIAMLALLALQVWVKRRRLPLRKTAGNSVPSAENNDEPSSTDAQRPSAGQEQLMQRLVQLMEDEHIYLRSGLKLSDLADALNTNSRYISDCINSSRGYSVSQFVNEYRVRHAQQLMRDNPDMKLTAVATDSGFANDKALVRSFRDFTGMTPTEWKSTNVHI